MKKKSKFIISSVLFITSSSLIAADSYEVIDMGVFSDGITPTVAYGLNDSGVAAGHSTKQTTINELDENDDPVTQLVYFPHAFTFDSNTLLLVDLDAIDNSENGTNIDIDDNYFNPSYAFDLNNSNTAVGFSYETFITGEGESAATSTIERATVTDSSLNITKLPFFIPDVPQNMRALSINDNDFVVGFGLYNPTDDGVNTLYRRGFIYDPSSPTELNRIEALGNDINLGTELRDINSNNIAVGWSEKAVAESKVSGAVYVDANNSMAVTELDLFNGEGRGFAWAINDANKIVGKSSNAENLLFTAFMYDIQTEELVDLGMLISEELCRSTSSRDCAAAFDINDPIDQNLQGEYQVVGTALVSTFPERRHAFLYEKGELKDLNKLIDCKVDPSIPATGNPDWVLREARAINNQGDIVGNGFLNGVPKAFMLKLRQGQAASLCQEVVVEDSGSGSVPLFYIFILGLVGLIRRKSV